MAMRVGLRERMFTADYTRCGFLSSYSSPWSFVLDRYYIGTTYLLDASRNFSSDFIVNSVSSAVL